MTLGPFPPLVFPALTWQKPFKLLRVMEKNRLNGQDGLSGPSADDLERAKRWLAERDQGRPGAPPDRRLLRALLQIYEKQHETARRRIEAAVLLAPAVSLRDLWTLWSQRGLVGRVEVTSFLANELARRASESRRFAERRVPEWVRYWGTSLEKIERALSKPEEPIRTWCERKPVPLSELRSSEGFILTAPQIKNAIVNLVGSGPTDWWKRTTSADARRWVEGPAGDLLGAPDLDYVRAVADRQLQEVGAEAQRIEEFKVPADAGDLRAWVLRYLGEPDDSPANWQQMSSRARAVFEWLMVVEQFDRILEEFRKTSSAYDRASFWNRYKPYLQDALYLQMKEHDLAVCLMRIRDILIVEFGATGNACYVYDATGLNRKLRNIPFDTDVHWVWQLKRKDSLAIGGMRLRTLKWLSHARSWEYKFESRLSELGVPPPRRDYLANGWRAGATAVVDSPRKVYELAKNVPASSPVAARGRVTSANAAIPMVDQRVNDLIAGSLIGRTWVWRGFDVVSEVALDGMGRAAFEVMFDSLQAAGDPRSRSYKARICLRGRRREGERLTQLIGLARRQLSNEPLLGNQPAIAEGNGIEWPLLLPEGVTLTANQIAALVAPIFRTLATKLSSQGSSF